MAPLKLEDNIKETLEKRTIKPSEASWNALANRLDTQHEPRNKVLLWWIGIAASLAAILFTATVFFNATETHEGKPVLVNTEAQIEENKGSDNIDPEQQQLAVELEHDKTIETVDAVVPKKEIKDVNSSIKATVKVNLAVAKTEKKVPLKVLEAVSQNTTLQDLKALEVVSQIQILKNQGQKITDADIDALLQKAQKEITYLSILEESTRTVDANALLQDVETDLQQSFRNKVFEALKNSYESVKTAVAERNN